MLATLRKRTEREDEGFTLIELMVVVLIIAILLAIAIPTFLGARERANDRAAQSSLRNSLTASKTLYTDSQDFSIAKTSDQLEAVEPSLTYTNATASDDFKTVDVAITPDAADTVATQWAGAAKSQSGKCFFIREVAVGTATLDAGTYFGKGSDAVDCTGANALTVTGEDFDDFSVADPTP